MSDYFTKKDAEEFKEDIKRYMGILAEDFQHRLNLAIDGLTGKIESTEERLNQKINSVEKGLRGEMREVREEIRKVRDELIAHRDNTEMHAQKTKRKKA